MSAEPKNRPKKPRGPRRRRPLYRVTGFLARICGAGLRGTGRAIATFWRLFGALDAALWNGFLLIITSLFRAVRSLVLSALGGLAEFVAWLPTRAGRAYAAASGFVLMIAGLWIADQLRLSPDGPTETAEASRTAPVDIEDPILARMGGKYIHLSEIEAAARAAGQLRPEDTLTAQSAAKRGLVEQFVEQRLLSNAALGADLHKTPDTARRLKAARDRILAASLLRRRVEEAVTEETIAALYEETADVTVLGDEIRARHILVETYDDALAILTALDEGADFTVLAREKSLDRATAPLGGEIGYFTRDMMPAVFSTAAFAATPGALAPPFQTERGWHILQVVDRRPTKAVGLNAVRDNIEQFLTERTIEEVLIALRAEADVVYYAVEPEPAAADTASGSSPSGSPRP